MNEWLHNLPILWMAFVIFGLTYLIAAAIYLIVSFLAAGERARSFKAVSSGMLSPLGVIFGLFVAFTAAHQRVIHEVSLAFYAHAAAKAHQATAQQATRNAADVQAAGKVAAIELRAAAGRAAPEHQVVLS